MRNRLKPAALALATLLTLGIGLTTAASPAYAAACSGSSCVGKDPQGTGCSSGAASLASVRPPGGGPAVILRWSSSCRANWTRFDDSGGDSPGYWTFWAETSDGHREYKMWNNALWTFMVNGNLSARACIKGVATDQYSCTGWY